MEQNQAKISEVPERRYTVEQLTRLKDQIEHYMKFDHHIRMLKQTSTIYDVLDTENPSPWATVKEGSYYLQNVHRLMTVYMECNPDNKFDKNMESVIETMTALGFDPSYNTGGFTDEAYGGTVRCFVSKGKGTMYYKLLHSKYKQDVKFFVEMVERDINIPIQQFYESIKEQLLNCIETCNFE